MTELILVRHGQSVGNEKKIITGQGNYPLTELGLIQAERVADRLIRYPRIDAVYASDLLRAYQTALPTARRLNLPITCRQELREMDLGEWVGLTQEERLARYPREMRAWREDYCHFQSPGGESIPDLYRRAVRALTSLAEAKENEGRRVAVFAHAGVIRCFYAFISGVPLEEIESFPSGSNGSITLCALENGGYTPIAYNRTDHLSDTLTVPVNNDL